MTDLPPDNEQPPQQICRHTKSTLHSSARTLWKPCGCMLAVLMLLLGRPAEADQLVIPQHSFPAPLVLSRCADLWQHKPSCSATTTCKTPSRSACLQHSSTPGALQRTSSRSLECVTPCSGRPTRSCLDYSGAPRRQELHVAGVQAAGVFQRPLLPLLQGGPTPRSACAQQ